MYSTGKIAPKLEPIYPILSHFYPILSHSHLKTYVKLCFVPFVLKRQIGEYACKYLKVREKSGKLEGAVMYVLN